MRDELLKSMNEYSSIAAAGVLMDINNGEIIWHGDKESLNGSNNKLLNQFINI